MPPILPHLLPITPHSYFSLGDTIAELQNKFATYKDVLTKPELVLVDRQSLLVGRDQELAQLAEHEKTNINGYTNGILTQRLYICPLVHGALGIGKTRLVADFNSSLRDRCKLTCPIGSIYMDFSRGDSLNAETSMSEALGLRLASHFFFGQSGDWLIAQLGISRCQQLFPFIKVIELITERYCTDSPIILTLHMDEFGVLPSRLLDSLMEIIATHMSAKHESRVWLLPYLTGTTVETGIKSITSSKISPKDILLGPLNPSASMSLVNAAIAITDKKELIGTIDLRVAVGSLGDNPRNLQLFLVALGAAPMRENLSALLSSVLLSVVMTIRDNYATSRWSDILGRSMEALTRLCLWALAGKEVAVEDRLNGISVEYVRSNGIIQLVPVAGKTTYTIVLPLVTLRALNFTLLLVPDELLDPFKSVSASQFESTLGAIHVLRNNMLVNLGPTACYRDLYPHAIGRPETLARVVSSAISYPKYFKCYLIVVYVSISKMEEYWVAGSPAAHDSVHKYPLTKIPIIGGNTTVDGTKVEFDL